MFNLPNVLSVLRFPLAFLFLQSNPLIRVFAVCVAGLTDWLDGFLARRYKKVNKLGTLLDPLGDKFFVLFALFIFIQENRLSWTEAALMASRDIAVLLYGTYLAIRGRLQTYEFRAIWSGKISTTLQLFVLVLLTFDISPPGLVFGAFFTLGVLALLELFIRK
jgi:CDP-diacylglycerol--glycerol-3-phosphate 3-phosphatidyltransferase